MNSKEAKLELKRVALDEGCPLPVVGDYAYKSKRRKNGKLKYVEVCKTLGMS